MYSWGTPMLRICTSDSVFFLSFSATIVRRSLHGFYASTNVSASSPCCLYTSRVSPGRPRSIQYVIQGDTMMMLPCRDETIRNHGNGFRVPSNVLELLQQTAHKGCSYNDIIAVILMSIEMPHHPDSPPAYTACVLR